MLNNIPIIKDILIFLKLKDIHNYLLSYKVNSNEIKYYKTRNQIQNNSLNYINA